LSTIDTTGVGFARPRQGGASWLVKGVRWVLLLTAALAAALGLAFFSIWAGVAGVFMAVCAVLVITAWSLNRSLALERGSQKRREEEMRLKYESIIATMNSALDLRDSINASESRRLAHIASVVAWQMGLRKEQLRLVEKAVLLHDIGKITIPESIASKASTLDEREWTEMKKHPELGYRLLTSIGPLREIADIVHAHHERYDGAGYPRGLAGNEIPAGARIYAVIDAYCAMTAERPYRRAMPHKQAVEELIRNSGSQFDPQVVQAFLQAEKRGLIGPEADQDKADELDDEPVANEV
jgi:putative nucleotidyltransferase with HDIG domain